MEISKGLLQVLVKVFGLWFLKAGDRKHHVVILQTVGDSQTLGMDSTKSKEIDHVGAAVGGRQDIAHVFRIGGDLGLWVR